MTHRVRLAITLGLVGLAAVVVAGAFAAVHLPHRYVYARPLAHTRQAGLLAIGLVILAATPWRTTRRDRVTAAAGAGGLLLAALMTLVLIDTGWVVPDAGTASTDRLVAFSPSLRVMSYRSGGFAGDMVEVTLRVQRRDGLATWEATHDLACFIDDSHRRPSLELESVRIIGASVVQVTGRDGHAYNIDLDPKTLNPVHELDLCADAVTRGD